MQETKELTGALADTIGVLRAENYERSAMFNAVERPDYWARLEGRRACFLIGGRGTGKTTALRSLTFEGQQKLSGTDIADWSSIGFYWRVETSVVSAFSGTRVSEADWVRLFGHYLNLRLITAALEFTVWREEGVGEPIAVDEESLGLACIALGEPAVDTLNEFSALVRTKIADFEASLNRLHSGIEHLELSMLGKPITHLVDALHGDPKFDLHHFVFAIDEFENLISYQQRVVNTLIKHAGDGRYTFKVGVKHGGIRDRSTLNAEEFLSEPADYLAIYVEDELRRQGFADFARAVCEDRLRQLGPSAAAISIGELFPELTMEEEARLLTGEKRRAEIRSELKSDNISEQLLASYDGMSLLEACMVGYWAEAKRRSVGETLGEAVESVDRWRNRVNNYGYSMLFTLRTTSGIKKYYSGWSVISHLAEGNLRTLLHMVYEALVRHIEAGGSLREPVGHAIQTAAAEVVGERAVFELGGLHARGSELLRLVLSLGRIFGVMAAHPHGHTPEVTQFRVDWQDTPSSSTFQGLLDAGVMHGALVSFPGDKNSARSGHSKEFDYQLHPLFAPFFAYSYRRKRRISIAEDDLIRLSGVTPHGTVSKILRRNSRNPSSALPEQLEMLGDFLGVSD